jgi:hypothetical protein
MKKLFILILMILLFSCEREQCRTCICENTNGTPNGHQPFTLCGDDLKEADGLLVLDSIRLGGEYRIISYRINCKL